MGRRKWIATVIVSVALVVGWWSFAPLPAVNRGLLEGRANGMWIAHRWFASPIPDAEATALGSRLREHRIRDLFFHVGPLDARGKIVTRASDHWRSILARIRDDVPGVRAFAWLGGVTTYSYGVANDTVDCGLPGVRLQIVETATNLMRENGFDGIHYDIEQVPTGDSGFLALLDESRGTTPLISVATNFRPRWLPIRGMWSDAYYQEVARRCDQIAVMGYDTGLITPRQYARYYASEVQSLCRLLPDRAILFGVPTYVEPTWVHHPGAESLEAALEGVALGLSDNSRQFQGIAIYAEWTTTQDDWSRVPR